MHAPRLNKGNGNERAAGRSLHEIRQGGSSSPNAELRERPRPASTENFYSEHEVLRMIDNLHAEKVGLCPLLPISRKPTVMLRS